MKIILASNSPIRYRLLKQIGIDNIKVVAPCVRENIKIGEPPQVTIKRLSRLKAIQVAKNYPGHLVIAADTAAVVYGKFQSRPLLLGKPHNAQHAAYMLRLLSDSVHYVMTAITVIDQKGHKFTDIAKTKIKLYKLSEEEIQAYIDSGEPFNKAGALDIEGQGGRFVEWIEGCYFNILGLPISLVHRILGG